MTTSLGMLMAMTMLIVFGQDLESKNRLADANIHTDTLL